MARDARYRNLSDNALIVLADVSVAGEIVWTNQAGLDFLAFDSLEELQKKNIIDLWAHPEQRETFLSKLRQDGHVRSYPIDYLTGTGKVVHALGSAILDDDMISMVAIDITSQTKANAEKAILLRDLGQRHTELQCIHAVTDAVRTRESLNEIFRLSVAAIPPAWQYPEITRAKVRFEDDEWVSEPFEETQWKLVSDLVVDDQVRGSVEVYYIEERPALDEGPFMIEERELLDDVAGTLSETVERRQAEQKEREARALFDSFVSVAPVGTAILGSDGRYVNINQALADINGVSIEDHIGRRPSQILPGELGKRGDEQVLRVLQTDRPVLNEELRGETAQQPGVTRHWVRSLFPLRGADQQTRGVGAVVIDVTEARNFEEQLRQSQKMEALGTLSGGIAHDFNNLLYPIILNASLLLESASKDNEDFRLLDGIISSSAKAKDLVSKILVFSRRRERARASCEFVSVIDEALGLVRPTIGKATTIELDVCGAPVPVACDSTQLYQVLVNLITNAYQAMEDAGVIKIALTTEENDHLECFDGSLLTGNFARLTVSDNGAGMDEETRGKMFDPFFTTKDKEQGTGLGLSTVLGIVEGHGGGLRVSSEPGTGTTIDVLLPLLDEPAKDAQGKGADDQVSAKRENILFVDDVDSIRESATVCLGRSGYNVTTASSGSEALDVFLANPDHFDLVVTDQSMGKLSGHELSIEILRLRPGMPIIICTGHSDSISPESSREIGIRAFLEKPASPEQLRRVVREVLDQTELERPLK